MDAQESLLAEIDALRAQIGEGRRALEEERQKVEAKRREIARLSHNIDVLTRMLFGKRSERRGDTAPLEAGQQLLALGEIVAAAERAALDRGAEVTVSVTPAAARPRKRPGRRSEFPEHLPVVRETFDLAEEAKVCVCGAALVRMGEEVTKELERVELTVVHEVARAKYACPSCREDVVTAKGPDRVIEKGLLGVGFLAHVIAERFGRHMPYHRLEAKYRDEGLSLSRSVLCASALRCADLLAPLVTQMKKEILAGPFVGTDDTGVPLQEGSDGQSRKAYVWAYRDLEMRCVYEFTERHSRDGPAGFLKGFRGYVQADAAPLYDALFHPEGPTEVACMAHARRKFVETESTDPTLSKEAIERFGALYGVEKEAADRELSPAERGALRREKAAPALSELFAWMERTRSLVLDLSPMGEAIDYAMKNRVALSRYLEDGRIPIDNNAVERALRRIVTGRRNWINVGNEEGGRRAAILYSLVQTCREIGIDPREYLQDVLLRISACSDAAKLTPHGWKQHFMPAVHADRMRALSRVAVTPR